MPIAVLVLALVAYAAALLAWPGFRRWGIAGGVAAAAGLALYFTGQAPETERSGTRIPVAELTLDQVEVTPTARGATLTARVRNDSEAYRLRELTLTLRLRDCPAAETPVEACPVIGEATAIARPDAPPGQIRALSAHFLFANLPPVAGTLRWDWRMTATRATADAPTGG
jgi:hypothetical protein